MQPANRRMPIPWMALALGAVGSCLLAVGIAGLVGLALIPGLEERSNALTATVIGGILLVYEMAVVLRVVLSRARMLAEERRSAAANDRR